MIETERLTLAVPANEHDHMIGPANANVTVVTYGDYECSACQSRHRATEKMFDELLSRVRFVYRHFPLLKVHPHALRAAEAAESAAAQGKFWEMHRLLYSRSDRLSDLDLRRLARKIGLDLKRFDREMGSGTYAEEILKDYYHSTVNGITGAPTTFINDVFYPMSGVELLATVRTILKTRTLGPTRT
jgi:formate-nitrite transporter family protein